MVNLQIASAPSRGHGDVPGVGAPEKVLHARIHRQRPQIARFPRREVTETNPLETIRLPVHCGPTFHVGVAE